MANAVLNSGQKWSLDGLVRNLLKKRLDKADSPRLSDWTRVPLSAEQLRYAALDAYAGLLVYEELNRRRSLRPTPLLQQ